MADELDPRLEASLRAALHHEADQLPLLIRSEDIERARRRRGGRRFALPASLLGLAAVLAILVATGGIGRLLQGNVAASPSPLRSPNACRTSASSIWVTPRVCPMAPRAPTLSPATRCKRHAP